MTCDFFYPRVYFHILLKDCEICLYLYNDVTLQWFSHCDQNFLLMNSGCSRFPRFPRFQGVSRKSRKGR